KVTWVEHLGDQNHLHVSVAGRDVVTLTHTEARLAVGDAVTIELSQPMFFGADGARVSTGGAR
ncbi:MAG: TOBE domain-containing protein, partial [Hyphomicrobiaceae bacterium]|nr:TOBE domain-containing protein [Hyphomicrobiaceae bacterium]